MRIRKLPFFIAILFILCSLFAGAQHIPTPKEHFGFDIGDDYMLTNYTQAEEYYKKVVDASDRVLLQSIGKTEEGRDQYMMIISSPENLKNLEKYRQISQKMARAEGLTDAEAKTLSKEGKAVVWIDGGLHATETVGSHQLIETLYELASRNDDDTKRILDNVIILLVHANPDGQEIVANWYMREKDTAKRNLRIPVPYQKYVGHDNNRDFYMNNMSETKNMSRVLYIEWIPQILYNHHQSSPAGAIVAGPPFRDPFNYWYDPLIVTGIDALGVSMINRLNAEGKPGYTRGAGSQFSTWWNGGLRTTAYFHNVIGLLTETWGNPTPSEVPLVADRLVPNNATPFPVTPQKWHFRQSIDYSVTMNYGVLDYAARNSDHLLYNIYLMGKNSIERGSRDTWTLMPMYIDSLKVLEARNRPADRGRQGGGQPQFGRSNTNPALFDSVFTAQKYRDARGYIIPSDQKDFYSAIKFVNALILSGVKVEKATAAFIVNGKNYPAGSFVVKADQAFRPHVLDMFEPQDHPNDFQYPGGPPVRPYDAAGWTLAYQTGIDFDRILDGFDGPFQTIPYGEVQTPASRTLSASSTGYILDPSATNSFIAVNELLKNKVDVYRLDGATGNFPKGSFYIPAKGHSVLAALASEQGIQSSPAPKNPGARKKIAPARIALYDQYGGSIPSGWVRWMMEQFQYPFSVVYPPDLDRGDLNKFYDVILFVDARMPSANSLGFSFGNFQQRTEGIPEEYHHMLGSITTDKTITQLKTFMENGGRVVAIGSSVSMAYLLDLPVRNGLTTMDEKGNTRNLSPNDYYVPGSILTVNVDNNQIENAGMKSTADVVFNNSNVFELNPAAVAAGIRPLAWFGEKNPLKSGWAWGASWLHDGVVAFAAPIGKGQFLAYSPEITFRAQPYGTFRMLFNQLYLAK